MVLHRALAYAKIHGDILTGVAGEYQLHDLVLTWREPREMPRRILSPGG